MMVEGPADTCSGRQILVPLSVLIRRSGQVRGAVRYGGVCLPGERCLVRPRVKSMAHCVHQRMVTVTDLMHRNPSDIGHPSARRTLRYAASPQVTMQAFQ